jgi:hypothetical protein
MRCESGRNTASPVETPPTTSFERRTVYGSEPDEPLLVGGRTPNVYLSPAVRTMRDDPTDGIDAALVVRFDDESVVDAVRDVVAEHGVVERETRFDNLHVTVPEPAVADLLAALPDGVAAVETRTAVADDPGHEG